MFSYPLFCFSKKTPLMGSSQCLLTAEKGWGSLSSSAYRLVRSFLRILSLIVFLSTRGSSVISLDLLLSFLWVSEKALQLKMPAFIRFSKWPATQIRCVCFFSFKVGVFNFFYDFNRTQMTPESEYLTLISNIQNHISNWSLPWIVPQGFLSISTATCLGPSYL